MRPARRPAASVSASGFRLPASGFRRSHRVLFGTAAELEAGAAEVDLVRPDAVLQQPPGLTVQVSGYVETARDAPHVGDEDERHAPVLLPRHGGNLGPLQ